jgi:sugar phosphate isomerase/epimerase
MTKTIAHCNGRPGRLWAAPSSGSICPASTGRQHARGLGRGHDVEFWARFLQALAKIDPNMCVNIEHDDVEFGPLEGLQVDAETLKAGNTALLR